METSVFNRSNFQPTAGSSLGNGWNIMWKKFPELLVITLIYSIISIPMVSLNLGNIGGPFGFSLAWFLIPLAFFGFAYAVFLVGPIGYSVNWTFLKAVRGEKIEIKDMFSVFQRNYLNAVAASIIVGIIVGVGMLMLIVPGIIFACRLAFVSYLVIDKEMDIMEALRTSWDMTKGYGWHIFFIGFLSFFIIIAGLIMLFFGVLLSSIWISTTYASLYHAVCIEKGMVPEEDDEIDTIA